MNRHILAGLASTILLYFAPPVAAQLPEEAVLEQFESVAESVIRIRTIADLELEQERRTGQTRMPVKPYSVDGTGVVVGELVVDGRTEYLILTNHHVADASNYVMEEAGYLRVNPTNTLAVPSVEEASYLMREEGEEISGDAIQLIELVRRVRGDMTLMRTSGADRELTVFEGSLGYVEGEITPGVQVLTSGYPWGGGQITAVGTILETDYLHELGLPHDDFVLDLPVEPGQSGGPLFLVEPQSSDADAVQFRLIGLVHAKDRERNYGVPYRLWEDSLDEFPAELQGRMIR